MGLRVRVTNTIFKIRDTTACIRHEIISHGRTGSYNSKEGWQIECKSSDLLWETERIIFGFYRRDSKKEILAYIDSFARCLKVMVDLLDDIEKSNMPSPLGERLVRLQCELGSGLYDLENN